VNDADAGSNYGGGGGGGCNGGGVAGAGAGGKVVLTYTANATVPRMVTFFRRLTSYSQAYRIPAERKPVKAY